MIAYCINLPERTEKWRLVQPELQKLSINVIKYNGHKIEPGYHGCRMSHLGVMQEAINKYPDQDLLILEDDVQFLYHDPMFQIENVMRELPEEWDILYLGGTPTKKQRRYSDSLFHVDGVWTTHAMIFNHKSAAMHHILENNGGGHKIDVYYAEQIQKLFNCFMAYPMIATQMNGYSDIRNKNVKNGDYIAEHYNRFMI